jgi:hypothetical protein
VVDQVALSGDTCGVHARAQTIPRLRGDRCRPLGAADDRPSEPGRGVARSSSRARALECCDCPPLFSYLQTYGYTGNGYDHSGFGIRARLPRVGYHSRPCCARGHCRRSFGRDTGPARWRKQRRSRKTGYAGRCIASCTDEGSHITRLIKSARARRLSLWQAFVVKCAVGKRRPQLLASGKNLNDLPAITPVLGISSSQESVERKPSIIALFSGAMGIDSGLHGYRPCPRLRFGLVCSAPAGGSIARASLVPGLAEFAFVFLEGFEGEVQVALLFFEKIVEGVFFPDGFALGHSARAAAGAGCRRGGRGRGSDADASAGRRRDGASRSRYRRGRAGRPNRAPPGRSADPLFRDGAARGRPWRGA